MRPMDVILIPVERTKSFNEVFSKEPSTREWIDTTAANAEFDLIEQKVINRRVYEFKNLIPQKEVSFWDFLKNLTN